MYDRLDAKTPCHMNITNLEVLQGLIANSDTSLPQLIHIKASTDLRSSHTILHWYNAGEENHFASAVVEYGNNDAWLQEWDRVSHLLTGRIESLERMERDGSASKLSHNMAYRLFGNLVDYADKYRGMQSVIIYDLEAVASVKLTEKTSGVWNIPPYFIDSVCHLAGLIMNGGDASETRDHFYVTPGWESMRFARPLIPGGEYRSYVKMRPTNPGFWAGDVYILQGDVIVGMVGGIIFKRFPRSLLGTLFSPPDKRKHAVPVANRDDPARLPVLADSRPSTKAMSQDSMKQPYNSQIVSPTTASLHQPSSFTELSTRATPTPATSTSTVEVVRSPAAAPHGTRDASTVGRALAIIAREAALEDSADLADDASFANLGIDSLLSLVLAEKFRDELDIYLTGTQFLEYPTIGEFRTWLEKHC